METHFNADELTDSEPSTVMGSPRTDVNAWSEQALCPIAGFQCPLFCSVLLCMTCALSVLPHILLCAVSFLRILIFVNMQAVILQLGFRV